MVKIPSAVAPALQPLFQAVQIGELAVDCGKVGQQLLQRGNNAPGSDGERLESAIAFDAELPIFAVKAVAQDFAPFVE